MPLAMCWLSCLVKAFLRPVQAQNRRMYLLIVVWGSKWRSYQCSGPSSKLEKNATNNRRPSCEWDSRDMFLRSTVLSAITWANRRWGITFWYPTRRRQIRYDANGDDMDDLECFADGAPTLRRGGRQCFGAQLAPLARNDAGVLHDAPYSRG